MDVHETLELLPLRQVVTASGDSAFVFAREGLLEWLSRPERYQIVGLGRGGQIRAVSELALAQARTVLREAYGASISFSEPTAHTYVDGATGEVMVPVMFLRLDAARSQERELLQLLQDKAADVKDVHRQRDRVVIRAELELPRCLGLEQQVADMTDGTAHFLSWLLGYQPASSWATRPCHSHRSEAQPS